MFKTDSFLGNKKSSLHLNVWRDHTTIQQDVLLHFGVIFYIEIRLKYEKKYLGYTTLEPTQLGAQLSWLFLSQSSTIIGNFPFDLLLLTFPFLPIFRLCHCLSNVAISVIEFLVEVIYWTRRPKGQQFLLFLAPPDLCCLYSLRNQPSSFQFQI